MPKLRLRHAFVAVLLLVAMLCQVTWALAGTTGGIAGTLTDSTNGKPVPDAKVTASAPSETVSTTTDAGGHFTFLNLAPDTYTISAEKDQFTPATIGGVTVFADQNVTVSLATQPQLKTIARITSRAAGNLVKPGTTADVYSVNAATQQVVSGSGGGFNLNNAYSGIYSQPGVTSYIGNNGWGQVFYIRGSAYSQVGYEFDGVPVNRAFDNYQANSLATLGQQELQVYTGGSPSGASSATLGGFINQVIKTGTYPGFGSLTGGVGVPGFYHSATAEAGGSNPGRTFSYYAGIMGYNLHIPFGTWQNFSNVAQNGNDQYGLLSNFEIASEVWATGGASLCGAFGNTLPNYCANNPDGGLYGTNFYANGTVSWQNGPWPSCSVANGLPPGQTAPGGIYNGACVGFTPFTTPLFTYADIFERDNVVNLHFAVPHKHDSGRDDVQLLFDNSMQYQPSGNSIGNNGGLPTLSGLLSQFAPAATGPFATGPFAGLCGEENVNDFGCAQTNSPIGYMDTFIFGPGTSFAQPVSTAKVVPYYFPSSPTNRALNDPFTATITSGLPTNLADSVTNNGSIWKLQYTKNIGTNAYVRLFGYTFYSDWLINGPTSALPAYFNGLLTPGLYGQETGDYELATHSRGVELQFADQINAQNLLRLTGNYTTATVARWNNGSWRAGYSGSRTRVTDWTNGDPNNPICYAYRARGGATPGSPVGCDTSAAGGTFGNPIPLDLPTACGAGGTLVGTPGCNSFNAGTSNWLVTVPSGQGTFNTVKPDFVSAALEDEFRPNSKLDLNVGVRYEMYQYVLPSSDNPEFNFWFNNYAQVLCYDPVTKLPMFSPLSPGNPAPAAPIVTTVPLSGCGTAPSGVEGLHPVGNLALCDNITTVDCGPIRYTAVGPTVLTHVKFTPRIGGTYTLNPDTVLRFSAGTYTQPTETAFEQYLDQSGKRAANFDYGNFFGLGFTNPVHDNPVQFSNNFDLSIEHHFKNTDWTMKLSPFYRDTHNELVSVVLGPNFASGVNVGHQHSWGLEVGIQKGDPSRDGWSGGLSYTWTRAILQYGSLPSGTNAIDYLNNYVKAFNALTQAGGGSPCYSPTVLLADGTNAPSNCAAPTDIKNPYFGITPQPLLDRNAWYDTYPNEPPNDPLDQGVFTAIWPSSLSMWFQYKHNKWSIAPNITTYEGSKYGSPTDVYGVDPRTCTQNQGAATTSTGGPIPGLPAGDLQNPDFQSCVVTPFTASGFLAIPNPYTGHMDSMAQYHEPWIANIGALVRYDISPKLTATVNLTNIANFCWGGTSTPWSTAFKPNSYVCSYLSNAVNYVGPLAGQPGFGGGFFYGDSPTSVSNDSPTSMPKPFLYPWAPSSGAEPFQAYFQLQIKF